MLIRILSSFFAFITALLSVSSVPAKKCEPEFNGTFIQSWMCAWWDDNRWQDEIAAMEEAGIEYLILQSTATYTGGEWVCYYESETEPLKSAFCGGDVIESALKNCAGTGIKVFVGLADYDNWWVFGGITREYSDNCALMAEMEKEIYAKYYGRYSGNFYGWYFTPEINNVPTHKVSILSIAAGLNKVINTADETDPALPVLLSPYYTEYLSVPSVLAAFPMWQLFMQTVHFRDGDIFCPQDAVGAGWIQENDLEKVWKMYFSAVESCPADIRLWANCENMTVARTKAILQPPATLEEVNMTSTLDRFVRQMDIASRYAENIITFSFNHYYSPFYCNEAYFDTYLDYLKNGHTLESQAPTAPGNPDISDGMLRWSPSEDNIGIGYYIVYCDDEPMKRIEANEELTCAVQPGHGYGIVALDAAGNRSGLSETVYYVE